MMYIPSRGVIQPQEGKRMVYILSRGVIQPSLGVDSRLFSKSRLSRAIILKSRQLVEIQNESR